MKFLRYFLGGLILLFFLLPIPAFALEVKSGEDVDLSGKTINDNLYIVASETSLEDTIIKGDLYLFASDVKIENLVVEGDVFLAGANLDIDNLQCQDLKIGAAQAYLENSKISGELLAGVSNISIKDTQIDRNLYLAGAEVSFKGEAKKDLKIYASNARINGVIAGDVFIKAESLVVGADTNIGGKLTNKYYESQARISDDAKITGGLFEKKIEKSARASTGFESKIPGAVFSLLTYLLVGLILILIFPKFIPETAQIIGKKNWVTLGLGLAFLFVVPVLLFIIFFTIIGIPISIIAFGVYGLAIYLARLFAGLWIGQQIIKKSHPVWQMALGVAILTALYFIPIIGGLVKFVALVFGLGALTLKSYEFLADIRKKKMV